MIPVEGHVNLFRDETSGAIINKDSVGYQNYIRLRNERKKQKEEIDKLKNDVNEIKNLLLELINKNQS
jgi:SPX domain protein involved in polyphosphate accumulation